MNSQKLSPYAGAPAPINLLLNPSFENGNNGWNVSSLSSDPIVTVNANDAHSGSGYAWLGGYADAHDVLYQDVVVGTSNGKTTLQFWIKINTKENTLNIYDTLKIEIYNAQSGALLKNLANYSNLDRTNGWVQSPLIDLSVYQGQTLRLKFTADNDIADTTSFFIDDVVISTNETVLNDTVVGNISGPRANYVISQSDSGFIVTNIGNGSVESFSSKLSTLKFSDLKVTLGIAERASAITSTELTSLIELYVAYFNRLPDAEGMDYWISRIRKGDSLDLIGTSFYSAAVGNAALTGYSATMTNDAFVRIVYKNVLGRLNPDQEGLDYWKNSLANGSQTRGSLVRTMIEAAHGLSKDATFGWVHNLLVNKANVANYIAIQNGISFNTVGESITKGVAIASAVTHNDLSAAIAQVDNLLPDKSLNDFAFSVQSGNSLFFDGSYQGSAFKMLHTGRQGTGAWSVFTGTSKNRIRASYSDNGGLREILALDRGVRMTVQTINEERVEYRFYAPNRSFLVGSVLYKKNGNWYQGTMLTEAFSGYGALTDVENVSISTAISIANPVIVSNTSAIFDWPNFELISTANALSSDEENLNNTLKDPFGFNSYVQERTKQFHQIINAGIDKAQRIAKKTIIIGGSYLLAEEIAGVLLAEGVMTAAQSLKDFVKARRDSTTSANTSQFNQQLAETSYMRESTPVPPSPRCNINESFVNGFCQVDGNTSDGNVCTYPGASKASFRNNVCLPWPVITSISPTSVQLLTRTDLTINGKFLTGPQNLEVIIDNASEPTSITGDSTKQIYSFITGAPGKDTNVRIRVTNFPSLWFDFKIDVQGYPVINEITPSTAVMGALTTFTVTGLNLISGMSFSLDGCTGVTEISSTSTTSRQFICTPTLLNYRTGYVSGKNLTAKSFNVLVEKATLNVPIVTSVSPLIAVYGEDTEYTISGTDLPDGLNFFIEGCSSIAEKTSSSPRIKRIFTCSSKLSGINKAYVKDKVDGITLKSFEVLVNDSSKVEPDTIVTSSPIAGLSKFSFNTSPFATIINQDNVRGYSLNWITSGSARLGFQLLESIFSTATVLHLQISDLNSFGNAWVIDCTYSGTVTSLWPNCNTVGVRLDKARGKLYFDNVNMAGGLNMQGTKIVVNLDLSFKPY